jgi:hypothetical protein
MTLSEVHWPTTIISRMQELAVCRSNDIITSRIIGECRVGMTIDTFTVNLYLLMSDLQYLQAADIIHGDYSTIQEDRL